MAGALIPGSPQHSQQRFPSLKVPWSRVSAPPDDEGEKRAYGKLRILEAAIASPI